MTENLIKIASWNVNSVGARLENLTFWIKESKPDIVLLQELKCVEEKFPAQEIEDLGYNITLVGQKSYNGVAILSKFPIEDVTKTLPAYDIDNDDEQARYIEAIINVNKKVIRVASIYVPNGGSSESDVAVNKTAKFIYKMNFYKRLYQHFKNLLNYNEITILGGDYNVAHQDIDVYNPKNLKNTVCFHEDEQRAFNSLLNLGYDDSFRACNPATQAFSWWDYRGNSWSYNKGMRIDYLLTSPLASDHIKSTSIEDKETMERTKPSDHCPVICYLDI